MSLYQLLLRKKKVCRLRNPVKPPPSSNQRALFQFFLIIPLNTHPSTSHNLIYNSIMQYWYSPSKCYSPPFLSHLSFWLHGGCHSFKLIKATPLWFKYSTTKMPLRPPGQDNEPSTSVCFTPPLRLHCWDTKERKKLYKHCKREVSKGIYEQVKKIFYKFRKTKWDMSVLVGEMELKLSGVAAQLRVWPESTNQRE